MPGSIADGAGVQRLDVGMILGFGEDPGDDLALLGDAQALFGAERLDIDAAGHAGACLVQNRGRVQSAETESAAPAARGDGAFPIAARTAYFLAVRLRLVPRPIFLARVRRCSA